MKKLFTKNFGITKIKNAKRILTFRTFLVILASGIMMTACKKEEKNEISKTNVMSILKSAPVKPKPASNGRKFVETEPDCINTPEACAPYDVVVTPTGTTIKCYKNFVSSILEHKEYEFFADKEQVKQLFPFLLDKEWNEFYELCLRKDMKFIEEKIENKYFYFLVTEETNPEEFKPGMDYLDLVVNLEK
ncbi:MAG TPA: hypothetical protein PLP65_01005 [Bacteroidales bacterium]|nr:hypothetical protein [Bacteroidales bacterium]